MYIYVRTYVYVQYSGGYSVPMYSGVGYSVPMYSGVGYSVPMYK